MQNEELKSFENTSDDWLAKEKAYEDSVSVWDFDEGEKIRIDHHKYHLENEKKINIANKKKAPRNNNIAILIVGILMFALLFLISIFDNFDDFSFMLPIIIFIFLSLFFSAGGRK